MIIFSYWRYNFINSLITVSNLCFQDLVKWIIYYHTHSKTIFLGIYAKRHVLCGTNVTIKYDMPILYYEIIKIRFNTKSSQ